MYLNVPDLSQTLRHPADVALIESAHEHAWLAMVS